MGRRRKNCMDVEYYVPGRKRSITGSTKAMSDFLALVHIKNPTLTIYQIREILTDKRRCIFNTEAVSVLDAHIAAGCGNDVPKWR